MCPTLPSLHVLAPMPELTGDDRPLSLRQDRFIEALVRSRDANIKQAALAAGYSKESAANIGHRLLRKPHVRAAYEARKRDHLPDANVTVDDVVRELAAIGFADATQAFSPDGGIRPLNEWPAFLRRAVASIEIVLKNAYAGDGTTDRVLKVRFHPKDRALELLAKYLGMLVERREVGAPGEFAALSDTELASRIHRASVRLAQLTAPIEGETVSVEPQNEP